jgi:mannose-6-phosphate isomerase
MAFIMISLYPLHLQASLHETLWGGRRLEGDGWKKLPPTDIAIGEAWETEINTLVQNGSYAGKSLGEVVDILGASLLGKQAISIYGQRFPLLAKFIDAHAQLSVQVHPDDTYAAQYEGGKLGKTEFWYILAAEPEAKIVYGFKTETDQDQVKQAIQNTTLQNLLHEEYVQAGDVIFVPAGTVHAIGSGILLYELQEYSDVTYRMYDYGRLSASGKPRELHIERSLDVTHYTHAPKVKVKPVSLPTIHSSEDRCLVACRYFLTREIQLKEHTELHGAAESSCIILTCLGDEARIFYGDITTHVEHITRGETLIIPAALGRYRIQGQGALLCSYVPEPTDVAWQLWREENPLYKS